MSAPAGWFTQCTHCRAYFRVRAVTLRVGQGAVFCTSCRSEFNALERLQEGDPGFPILDAIPVTESAGAARSSPSKAAGAAAPAPAANRAEAGPTAGGTDAGAEAVADGWSPEAGAEEADAEAEAGVDTPERVVDVLVEPDAAADEEEAPILARIPVLEPEETLPGVGPAAAEAAEEGDEAVSATATEPEEHEARSPHAHGAHAEPRRVEPVLEEAAAAAVESAPDAAVAPGAAGAGDELPAVLWPEVEAPAAPARPIATAAWSVGILLLLVTLAGQFVYFQSANLAYYPALHPWLERFCAVTGCRVPLPRDLGQLDILDRRVYDDPSAPHALVISLILQNNAGFRQAYPRLQVRFFDLAGRVIALRRFAPRQYLPQGTDPAAGFPAHGSIPVTLQIVDPGKDAVSYDFEFR